MHGFSLSNDLEILRGLCFVMPKFEFFTLFFFDPVLNFVCFLSYHSICIYLLHFLTIYVVEIHHKGLLSVILLNKLRYRETL